MTFDETIADNPELKTVQPQSAEVVKEAVDNQEETVKEPDTQTETDAEKTPETEPAKEDKEKESSVIRAMRKQFKMQQQEIAELRKALTKPEPVPTRENFDSDEAYIQSLVDHRIKAAQSQPTQTDPLQQRISEAQKTHADFAEAMEDIEHVKFKPGSVDAMREAMETLQYGSDVLYYMAKNPTIAEEMSLLSPAAFAAKLGEIHSDIKREKTKPVQRSSAPVPISPVTKGTKPSKSYDEMDQEEFERTRRKERAAHKMRYA